MKRSLIILSAFIMVALTACEKDNLKEPNAVLSGRVTFQGQPIGVRSDRVQFEIWQPGFDFFTKIPLNIAQDGSFKAALFNGNYKLVRLVGAGPWADNTDTINVSLNGTATVDIPVEPFFVIKNASFVKSGTNVNATFTIEKNGTHTKTMEVARLFLGRYYILDLGNNAGSKDGTGIVLGQPITVTLAIPTTIINDDFIFARVGVKTTGIGEYLYTPSTKIQMK